MSDGWAFNLATLQQGSQRRNDGIKQLLRMGEGQLSSSKPLLASCTFSKVLEMQDDHPAALTGRAMALLLMGMPSSALVDAEMATQGVAVGGAPPPESLYVKACALRDLGRPDLATPVFAAALAAATEANKPPAVLLAYQTDLETCRADGRRPSDGRGQLSPRRERSASSHHRDTGDIWGREGRDGPLSARPHYAEPVARNGGNPRGRHSSGWGAELISLSCPAALEAITAAEHAAEVAEFVSTHLFSLLHPSQGGAGTAAANAGSSGDARPMEASQAWLQRLERRGSESHLQQQPVPRGPLNLFQTMAPGRSSSMREHPGWAASTMGPQGASSYGMPAGPQTATLSGANHASHQLSSATDAASASMFAMSFPAPAWGDSATADRLANGAGPSPVGLATSPSPRTRNLAEAAAGRAAENGVSSNGAAPPPRAHAQAAATHAAAAGSLAAEFLRASHGEAPRGAPGGAGPAAAACHAQPLVLSAGGFQLVAPESSNEMVASDSSGAVGSSASLSPAQDSPRPIGAVAAASKRPARPVTATVRRSVAMAAGATMTSSGPPAQQQARVPSPPTGRPISAVVSPYGSSSYVRGGAARPLTARTKG